LEDIFFWKNNIISLNVRLFHKYNIPKILSFSDASDVACVFFLDGTTAVCHRMWKECESVKSSTWRELKAIHFCLLSFRALIAGSCVKWHADNQGAVRILDVGSPKQDLHAIAIDIFTFCKVNNVSLLPEWVPRDVNVCADEISRMIDYDDWTTTR